MDVNLTVQLYLILLEEAITPRFVVATKNDAFGHNRIFQQDGALTPCYVPEREYINEKFPGHWIGHRRHIE